MRKDSRCPTDSSDPSAYPLSPASAAEIFLPYKGKYRFQIQTRKTPLQVPRLPLPCADAARKPDPTPRLKQKKPQETAAVPRNFRSPAVFFPSSSILYGDSRPASHTKPQYDRSQECHQRIGRTDCRQCVRP